jgi:nucleoside-diphosphate-sugar epimerase
MKKRILVTGGAGFIGSHLCEKILSQDNEVICVDNFFTGSKQNIIHLLDNPYFEIVRHDITLKELNWEPKIQLEKGLIKTINYFERLLSNER